MDSEKPTIKERRGRLYGMRVSVAVWGGLLFSLVLEPEMTAQDRPAILRPSSTSKATKQKKRTETAKAAKAANDVSVEGEGAAPAPASNIGKILPKGRTLKGVKLPSYTGDRLSSVMTAITMKRLDEKHLDMEEVSITMYAKPGEKDTLILTERGIYDLEKEEITSDTRTRIEQGGVFDLEGDEMVFDANTQKGKMTGNVKMLLYKADKSLRPNEDNAETEIEKREDNGK